MSMEYVNLLPDSLIKKAVKHGRVARWLLVGLAAVVLVLGYSFSLRQRVTGVKEDLVLLEKQVAEKQALTEKLTLLEEDIRRAAEKQGTANDLLDQPDWAYVLSDIADAAQNNAWLEKLTFTKVKVRRQSTDGESAEEEEIVETRFNAEGHVPSNFELANFMARLERSSRFDDVELDYSELRRVNTGEPHVMRFQIEGKLL